MDEFKNNKDGKIEELKVRPSRVLIFHYVYSSLQASISKQKSALQKHSVIVKTQQKELQTATLELGVCRPFVFLTFGVGNLFADIRIVLAEQNDGDIEGEKGSLEEAKAGIAKLHKELDKLGDEVAASEVLSPRSQ